MSIRRSQTQKLCRVAGGVRGADPPAHMVAGGEGRGTTLAPSPARGMARVPAKNDVSRVAGGREHFGGLGRAGDSGGAAGEEIGRAEAWGGDQRRSQHRRRSCPPPQCRPGQPT